MARLNAERDQVDDQLTHWPGVLDEAGAKIYSPDTIAKGTPFRSAGAGAELSVSTSAPSPSTISTNPGIPAPSPYHHIKGHIPAKPTANT